MILKPSRTNQDQSLKEITTSTLHTQYRTNTNLTLALKKDNLLALKKAFQQGRLSRDPVFIQTLWPYTPLTKENNQHYHATATHASLKISFLNENLMLATITAICISQNKRKRKTLVKQIKLHAEHSIVGDAHAGTWHR